MKIKQTAVLAAILGSLISACAVVPMVGSRPSEFPPKLVTTSDGKELTWDNPSAFGPVPAELAEKAAAACASLDTKDVKYKALGYHPKAMDQNSKPFAGGGYFCVAN